MKFLVNTITDWDEIPRARHQVTYALAKKYDVVYVSSNRIGFCKQKKLNINAKLKVIIPYFPIGFKIRIRISFINKVYQKWLFKKLYEIYPDHCVINFDFTAEYLTRYFKSMIYYCNDDHIGISIKYNPRFVSKYHQRAEQFISRNSIFCIGTSDYLVKKLKENNENAYLIKLGAPNINNYNIGFKTPSISENIHIGCIGFINYNTIDLELVKYLLNKPDIKITLVGPINKKVQKLFRKYNKIKFTGSLIDKKLYEEINTFDVGFIPYSLKSSIDRTPNKLWQYLALGKPVVMTNIKSLRDWTFPESFIYVANSYKEFYEKICKAFTENNEKLYNERKLFAESNSWDVRIKQLLKIYEDFK